MFGRIVSALTRQSSRTRKTSPERQKTLRDHARGEDSPPGSPVRQPRTTETEPKLTQIEPHPCDMGAAPNEPGSAPLARGRHAGPGGFACRGRACRACARPGRPGVVTLLGLPESLQAG